MRATELSDDLGRLSERRLSLQLVHQWLESYVGGMVDADSANKLAEAWLLYDIARLLTDGCTEDCLEALSQALKKPTRRGMLQSLFMAHEMGETLEVSVDLFTPTERAMLKEVLGSRNGRTKYHLIDRSRVNGCPKCYCALSVVAASLNTTHIAQCSQCGQILVLLEP